MFRLKNSFVRFASLFVIGICLVWLSVPQIFASLNMMKSADALRGLQQTGDFPDEPTLADAIGGQRLALRWLDTPDLRVDYATLLLAEALRESVGGIDPSATLADAENQLTSALMMSPASHIAWNLLAQTNLMQRQPQDAIVALEKSYRAVPLDMDNSLSRLSLTLPLLDTFDPASLRIIGEEVKAMAITDVDGLAATALATLRADDVTILMREVGASNELVEKYVVAARQVLERSRR